MIFDGKHADFESLLDARRLSLELPASSIKLWNCSEQIT